MLLHGTGAFEPGSHPHPQIVNLTVSSTPLTRADSDQEGGALSHEVVKQGGIQRQHDGGGGFLHEDAPAARVN